MVRKVGINKYIYPPPTKVRQVRTNRWRLSVTKVKAVLTFKKK